MLKNIFLCCVLATGALQAAHDEDAVRDLAWTRIVLIG
jgi:hypothetical protein